MNNLNFDLNLLRVFDALLIERSTTKAASRVHLSQPAVSAALSRLRSALNDPLFERKGNSLEPNAYALSVEPQLRELLGSLEVVLSPTNSFDPSESRQTFRLATSDYFADYLMPELVKRFSREAPNARVQITPLDAQDHLNSLERFQTDLIIFLSLPIPSWMRAKDLFLSYFRVLACKGNTHLKRAGVSPGEVIPFDIYCGSDHGLYSPSGDTRTWVDDELEKQGRKRHISATTSTFHSLAKVVEGSALLATVPELTATDFAKRYDLEVYRHPLIEAKSNLMMAWHYRGDHKPDQQWFRKIVSEELTKLESQQIEFTD